MLNEFPGPRDIVWNQYTNAETENLKLANENELMMSPFTRHLLATFNSSTFITFLENLTGIQGLIPDPHFRGGGQHQTLNGGHLGIHVDFNKYKRPGLYRRLNLLLYLNKHWNDEWGGHFELWSRDGKERAKKITPLFNRAALFSTSDFSYHGHPEPLNVPEGVTRKSLALYYYTVEPGPDVSTEAHSTLFPHTKKGRGIKSFFRAITPPIIYNTFRSIKVALDIA